MCHGGAFASGRGYFFIYHRLCCFRFILLFPVAYRVRLTQIPLSDPALANVPRSKIRDQLAEVGFDEARQADIVGGLSGGWKMKLELARAMLYNADLLLLDEVSPLKIFMMKRQTDVRSSPLTM